MSVLGNIRRRTGLLLIVVAGGVFLFLIQDAVMSSTSFFGQQNNTVGEIAGEQIDQTRFSALIAQYSENYARQQGKTPDEMTLRGIRDQAWKQLLFEIAYKEQFNELGILVTEGDENAESVDMVQGRFVDPRIQSSFKNEAGEFQKDQLIQYLQQIGDASTEEQIASAQQWANFEKQLIQDRLRTKYESLIAKSNYVTTAEAKRAYMAENDTASISYLSIPYSSIVDSTVAVSDNELEEYLRAHTLDFQVEQGRSFDFVVFDVAPSDRDIAKTQEKIAIIKKDFIETKDDTAFARSRSDNFQLPVATEYAQLPYNLKNDSANLANAGTVYGPFLEGNFYKLYKVIDFNKADTVQKATASHILIGNRTPEGQPLSAELLTANKQKAQQLLARALSGEDFATLAMENSEDPGSGANGGDLGEFKTGMMVPPFQNAVFSAKKTGVVPRLIESDFGYHIIKVTKKATIDEIKTKYTVASVDVELYASKDTRNQSYKQATAFWKVAENQGFDKALATDSTIQKQTVENVLPDATGFGSVASGRNILTWAYNDDTEVGDVSEIFRQDGAFIVTTLTGTREKGTAKLSDVKEQVKTALIKQKKADLIVDILEKHQGDDFQKRMESINKAYGEGYATKNFTPVTVNYRSNYISGLGSEPEVIGTVFGMTSAAWSEKIIGENGVYIIELKSKSATPEIADYSAQKNKIVAQFGPSQFGMSRDNQSIEKVIEENSDVKDFRYKFY